MDPMEKAISSFIMDVNSYLSFANDYGRASYKYCNFVLNKSGLLHIFISKNTIFQHASVANVFVEKAQVALKKRFLTENLKLKRAALIFLICKIYFTDNIANRLKLRITCEEWEVFKRYIAEIGEFPEYESTRIMFYQLFFGSFFKFTIRNKALAVDFGSVGDKNVSVLDPGRDERFWESIQREILILEVTDVVELKQLNAMREIALEPFKELFPPQNPLEDALADFSALKALIVKPQISAPAKLSRRDISLACRNFLIGSSNAGQTIGKSDESDYTSLVSPKKERKARSATIRYKKGGNSSSSDSEIEYKRMIRTKGCSSQNIMHGIGAMNHASEKLKKCYDPKS